MEEKTLTPEEKENEEEKERNEKKEREAREDKNKRRLKSLESRLDFSQERYKTICEVQNNLEDLNKKMDILIGLVSSAAQGQEINALVDDLSIDNQLSIRQTNEIVQDDKVTEAKTLKRLDDEYETLVAEMKKEAKKAKEEKEEAKKQEQ